MATKPTREQIRQNALDRRTLWRSYKSTGKTIDEIAEALNCSRQFVYAVTKPVLGEHICPTCCQHLQPEIELPKNGARKKK